MQSKHALYSRVMAAVLIATTVSSSCPVDIQATECPTIFIGDVRTEHMLDFLDRDGNNLITD